MLNEKKTPDEKMDPDVNYFLNYMEEWFDTFFEENHIYEGSRSLKEFYRDATVLDGPVDSVYDKLALDELEVMVELVWAAFSVVDIPDYLVHVKDLLEILRDDIRERYNIFDTREEVRILNFRAAIAYSIDGVAKKEHDYYTVPAENMPSSIPHDLLIAKTPKELQEKILLTCDETLFDYNLLNGIEDIFCQYSPDEKYELEKEPKLLIEVMEFFNKLRLTYARYFEGHDLEMFREMRRKFREENK